MKISRFILYIFILTALSSCGEDRTPEYHALIEDDNWILETMKKNYLWNNEMPNTTENSFFADPEDFLAKVVFQGNDSLKADIFSYVEMKDTTETSSRSFLQKTSTYGFDFELITDPTGTTNHTLARVLFVLPDSPAKDANIKRGDWISQVNGARVTTNNYGYLMTGDSTNLTVQTLTDNDGALAWSGTKKVHVEKSRFVENNPFYVDTTYVVNGMKIAYMVYNKFSTGPNDTSTETQYLEQMKQIFSNFKNESPDAFILDLRYNPGGYLTCAQEMASMLAPASALGEKFLTLQFNDSISPKTVSYNLESEFLPYNLNLKKIYIITSQFTASASEAIISSLRPYMGDENVITIGETTLGKNVALQPFTEDRLNFILWPVVAYVLNSQNWGDYASGIAPTYQLSEREYYEPLYPLGNIDEFLLKNTISLITTGSIDQATATQTLWNSRSSKSSTLLRHPVGMKIK